MVRYYCDRCESEVDNQSDLLAFSSEVGDVTVAAWRLRRDVCSKCLEEIKEVISKFFAKNTASKARRSL